MTTTAPSVPRAGSGEQGIAMIVALFMMLAMSVLGTSLMFVSQTETLSSHNYRLMSQARYGAESGVHTAANYLLSADYGSYMPGDVGDPAAEVSGVWSFTNYDTTKSPVRYNDQPVVLSWDTDASNYPVEAVKNAFAAAAAGELDVNDAPVKYRARATLKSMRRIDDAFTQLPVTVQTWEITAEGSIEGAREATVEVSSLVERQTNPIYAYAAFATNAGCGALSFNGGAKTDSYDSTNQTFSGSTLVTDSYGGNVGTNGNLTEVGSTTIVNGALATPRIGVGNCTTNNVTALSQTNGATVSAGLNQLSQSVSYPTPPAPNPLPPTTATDFKKTTGCPSGYGSICATSTDGATFTPGSPSAVVTMGNVTINAGAVLHLNAGTYVLNSFTMAGGAKIVIDSGPVVLNVAGVGETTPITITGQGIVNTSYDPSTLQILYAGTGNIKLAGGDQTAALFYAPNASAAISGGADLYGALVVNKLTETGGAAIHYDRNLQNNALTAGNYMLSAFTWKTY
jgi:hypothetical protein